MELTTAELIQGLTNFCISLWHWLGAFCRIVLTMDLYEFTYEVGSMFGTDAIANFVTTILQGLTLGLYEDIPIIFFLLIHAVLVWICVQVVKVVLSIFKLFI